MKVLITFLFLGSCLFGLGSSEPYKIYPDISMIDRITYNVTCNSQRVTSQEIRCCVLEKQTGSGRGIKKTTLESSKRTTNGECGYDASDKHADMVTEFSLVGKTCQATLKSGITEAESTSTTVEVRLSVRQLYKILFFQVGVFALYMKHRNPTRTILPKPNRIRPTVTLIFIRKHAQTIGI